MADGTTGPLAGDSSLNIVDIAEGSADFDLLERALETASLDSTVRGLDDITLFAPTDAAFCQLAVDLGYDGDTADEDAIFSFLLTALETLGGGDAITPLTTILQYHVSLSELSAADVAAASTVTTLLDGADLTPSGASLGDFESDLVDPSIIAPDLEAENGTIHAIDRVLLPFDLAGNTNIVDIAAGAADFEVLVQALTTAGLVDTIRTSDDITVFAPTDAAFAELAVDLGFAGDTTNEDTIFPFLVQALTDLSSDGDPIPLLTQILTYHVSPGEKTKSEIEALATVATLEGTDITPTDGALGDAEPDLADPTIILSDLQGGNGIIQGIDRVLLPLDIPGNTPLDNIVDIAAGSDDFNILVSALTAANLVDTMRDSDDITVFAPTDAAFTALATDLGFDGDTSDEDAVFGFLVQALTDLSSDGDPIPLLTGILTYHVSPGAKTQAEIEALATVATLEGTDITPADGALGDAEPDLADPTIVAPDIAASNGTIQGIDRVLLPLDIPGNTPLDNIVDIAAGSDDFNILVSALTAANLVDTVRDSDDITVFAPTDAAFTALATDLGFDGDTSDEDAVFGFLVQALTDLSSDGDPIPLLTGILTYHVSPGAKTQAEIEALATVATLEGTDITPADGALGDAEPDLPDPTIVAPDIAASNGTIQGIDRVLLPLDIPGNTPLDNIVDIAAGSDDFNILVSALAATGLTDTVRAADDITVFAPSDAAFTALATTLGFDGDTSDEDAVFGFIVQAVGDLVGGDPVPVLSDILLYHVSPGAKSQAEIDAAASISTLAGDATITPLDGALIDRDITLVDPTIATPDIAASNGTIQAIDAVLFPVPISTLSPVDPGTLPTLAGLVAASGGTFDGDAADFDMLLTAVQAAGLVETLDNPDAELTVFAPTDAAFIATAQALGFAGSDEAGAFAYIVDALTLLSSGGDPIPLLSTILTYHVGPEILNSGDVLGSTTIATVAGIDLGVMGDKLVDQDPDLPDTSLVVADLQASNGFAHAIDGVLLPVDILPSDGSNAVDFIIGGDAGETFDLGDDNDLVDAKGGDDTIEGGAGDDIVLGGEGTDTAVLSGNQAQYGLVLSANGVEVNDKGGAGTGMDFLDGVELIEFGDGAEFLAEGALNLDPLLNALSLTQEQFSTLAETYVAYFDRAPDALGLLFWADAFANGLTIQEIAEEFAKQPEAAEKLPDEFGALVDTGYDHLLERAPDDEGRAFWVEALESGGVTVGQFFYELIQGARNNPQGQDDVTTVENKAAIALAYSVTEGLTDVDDAEAVMAAYERSDPEGSLAAAQALIADFADAAAGGDGGSAFTVQLAGVIDDPFAI